MTQSQARGSRALLSEDTQAGLRAVAGDGRERFDLILLRERIAVLRAEERFAGTTLRAMRETRGGVCTLRLRFAYPRKP